MKRSIIVFGVIITVVGFMAFGFVDKPTVNNLNNSKPQIDSTNKDLSFFGINGGINVNYYNGMVTQFVASDKAVSKNQDLFYMVYGKYSRSNSQQMFSNTITQEKLNQAKLIDDIIENYPSNWIKDYRSVSIQAIIDGKEIEAISINNILTLAQKKLLSSVNIDSGVIVSVKYKTKNAVTNTIENREMKLSMGVGPKVEAEFIGGYAQMIDYLKENSLERIAAKKFNRLPQPSISFIVNENGLTENVKLTNTSGDNDIDLLLIELVKKMPKWEPAKNTKGLSVKQEFEFSIGMDGC